MWQALPPDVTQITEDHLVAFGDVDRALARFYEDALAAVVAQTGVHQNFIREWCETWLITSTGTRGFVHRDPESTQGMPNEVLVILEDRHLIRSEPHAGASWYELTHDRFVEPIRASNESWNKQREEKARRALSLLQQAERRLSR